MASVKLSTVMVHSSESYPLQLGGRVSVGDIARYLTQVESNVDASTLEIARPLPMAHRVRDIDAQTGDRLIIFTQASKPTQFPERLHPGDKILRFSRGDVEITSRGKKGLLMGKPDDTNEVLPDIDLRYFISDKMLPLVSRGCAWLSYDEQRKIWYISKLGQTRLMIDEYELGAEKVPLDGDRWLRLYHPLNQSSNAGRLLGEIHVQVQEVHSRDDLVYLEPGGYRLRVNIAAEQSSQTLNASPGIPMGQIVTSLVIHNNVPRSSNMRLYLMRLLPPNLSVHELSLGSDEFLYLSRSLHYARNVLLLHDVHNRNCVYTLAAGPDNDEKVIGCRVERHIEDPSLDVDLYDAIVQQIKDPAFVRAAARPQGWIRYNASDNTWWLRSDEQSTIPIYVNTIRSAINAPTRLISGDVLSIGPQVDDYFTRLEVEITSTTS